MATYVVVPRAVFTEAIWSLPFSAVVAKAEADEDGLFVLAATDAFFVSRAGNVPLTYTSKDRDGNMARIALPDVAVLRGDGHDKTFLHGQGW